MNCGHRQMMLFVHIFHKHSLHFSMKHIETYEKTWKHVTKHLLQALHRVWRRPLLMANEVGGLRLSYCHGNDSNVFKDHSVFFQRKLRCLAGAEIKLCYEGVCVCSLVYLLIIPPLFANGGDLGWWKGIPSFSFNIIIVIAIIVILVILIVIILILTTLLDQALPLLYLVPNGLT